MVVNRRDRTVKCNLDVATRPAEFSWALPTDLSARELNGLDRLLCPEGVTPSFRRRNAGKRYELERDVARRIWLEG